MSTEPSATTAPGAQSQNGTENGQKLPVRPARQQLLLELDMQRQAQDFKGENQHDYFVAVAYPPSTAALTDLKPIGIADLELETHHRGRVLVVRTLDDGCRLAGVQTVVQDENGETHRLAFYNCDASLKAEDILPEDMVFAIKEPFYTADAECGPCLRVDHPSDIVQLDLDDDLVSTAIRDALTDSVQPKTEKSASDWKAVGNAAYKASDYRKAVQAYTRGVMACTADETGLKQDILRNRSIVNTYLKRYETAEADANGAVISQSEDEASKALNAKSYYRAGRAAYELRNFQGAKEYFEKVKNLTPADKDVAGELKRIEQRLKEQSEGDYDFGLMSKSSSEKHNRLDFADFTTNTEVKEAQGHGRGLFATKDLSAGDVVLVEKAFCAAFDSDPEARKTYNILNRSTERRSAGTQSILLFNITQKLMYNPKQATACFDLVDGGYKYRETSFQSIDGTTPIDTFRVMGIIEHNTFACPTVRSSSKAAMNQAATTGGYHSTGLWLHTSYINHACEGNSMRSFIGDMIIIRASKNITKGEEILMPYRLPHPNNELLQADLQKVFGFRCDCPICTVEQNSAAAQRSERIEVVEKLSAILSAHPTPLRQQADRRTVTQVERLFTRLEGTYDDKTFANVPRVGLVAPGLWLCQAYTLNSGISRDKVSKTALAVLHNMGFKVDIAGQKVTIDRQHAQVEGSAIEAAMHAARVYNKQGKTGVGLAKQMEDFAKSLYLVMTGEMRGFEENFGKL